MVVPLARLAVMATVVSRFTRSISRSLGRTTNSATAPEFGAGAVGQRDRHLGEVLDRLPVAFAEGEAHGDLALRGAQLRQLVAAHRTRDGQRDLLGGQPELRRRDRD